ncbi:PilZ domain-containing protein [Gammaproteobacteria bacterium]
MPTFTKRAYQRYPCHLPIKITTERGEIDGVAANIGLGGMLVESTEFLAFDSMVKLRFRLPAMTSDTEVTAYVRWNKENAFGLQFSNLRAKDVWGLNQFFEKSGAGT